MEDFSSEVIEDVEDDTFEDDTDEDIVEDEVDDDVDEEDEDEDDDPWKWTKEEGLDPNKVQKTWKQYTQTRQELSREAEELAPFKKLKDEILADPGLVKVIDEYYKNGRPVERDLADVKEEMLGLKNQIATERELADVQGWISKSDYPAAKDEAILRYAVENGIPNLKAAYKDMMFEKIQDRKADKVVAGIKKSKGAQSPTTKKPSAGTAKVTKSDIYNMSDEDFIKNYDKIVDRYQQ
jgi:hypothetical protein